MEFNKLFKNWDFKHTEEYHKIWESKISEASDPCDVLSVILNFISEEESPMNSLVDMNQWIYLTKGNNPTDGTVYDKIKEVDPKHILNKNFNIRFHFIKHHFFKENEDYGHSVLKGIEKNIIFLKELEQNNKKYKLKSKDNLIKTLSDLDKTMNQKNLADLIKFIKRNSIVKFNLPLDITVYCDRQEADQFFSFMAKFED